MQPEEILCVALCATCRSLLHELMEMIYPTYRIVQPAVTWLKTPNALLRDPIIIIISNMIWVVLCGMICRVTEFLSD